MVNAATGTGKTVAYLAPVIHHMQKFEPRIERTSGTYGVPLSFSCVIPYLLLVHALKAIVC